MAKKLATGHTENRKDSAGRHLGFKIFPGEMVQAGAIILRQRGTKWYAGKNTTMGRDHTINSTVSGRLIARKNRKYNLLDVLL